MDRAAANRCVFPLFLPCLLLCLRELNRLRQVNETRRDAPCERVAQGLPFRREMRERIVDGKVRRVRRVDQQRDGWLHSMRVEQGQRILRIGRPIDQYDIRLQFFQGRSQAARASGTVMAHTENGEAHY